MSQLGVQSAQPAASVAAQSGIASQPALARVQLPAHIPESQRVRPRKAAQPLTAPRDLGMGSSPLAPESLASAYAAVELLDDRPEQEASDSSESLRDRSVGEGASYLDVHQEQSDATALSDFRDGRYENFEGTEDLVAGFEG